MMPRFFSLSLLCLALAGCWSSPTEKAQSKANGKETIVDGNTTIKKFYNSDGSLHKEIHYDEKGLQKGPAIEYYNNGKIFQEVHYDSNRRDGLARRYYETGVLSQETPYKKDKMHGIQKRYRRSGELMAEVPYEDDHLCIGLKEYSTDGKVKVQYPKIIVTPIDNILRNDTYLLRLSLSDGTKNGVEYYLGDLENGKYIGEYAEQINVVNGVGEIKYIVSPGMFMMRQLNVVAKIKTSQGNYYITQRPYNLAIDAN